MSLKGIELANAMQSDPNFAKLVIDRINQKREFESASVLSQDYAGVEDFLKRKEEARVADFNAKPFTGQIPMRPDEYQGLSPLEAWRERNSAMMASGNPVLQEQALAQLKDLNTETLPRNTILSTAGKMAHDAGLDTDSTRKWIEEYPLMSKMYEPSINKPLTTSDYEKWMLPGGGDLPPGTTWKDLKTLKAVRRNEQTPDTAGRLSMLQAAISTFPMLDSYILRPDNTVNRRVMDGAFYIGSDPTKAKIFATGGLKFFGNYNKDELAQVKQVAQAMEMGFQGITRTETGAAMPPEEVDNTKARFQPTPTDGDVVIRQKYLAMKYFIENAANMMDRRVQYNGTKEELTREVNKAADIALSKFLGVSTGGNDTKPEGVNIVSPGDVDLSDYDLGE